MELFEGTDGTWLRRFIIAATLALAAFLVVETIGGIQSWHYIGAGLTATNTITVSGHGESVAVPDIATFSFSVVSDKSTVAAAQADATTKINAITDYLTSAGVSKNDIQTSDYSVNPQYSYSQSVCPPVPVGGTAIYCPPSQQTLTGYEVRQTTTIKVRDTTKAGDLLAGVGGKGATEVSGLNFTFDNPDTVQNDARSKAITDAKSKAQTLASELGVSLVRVVSYNENGNVPTPIYYAKDMAVGASGSSASVAPDISTGQNKVTSDVTITYEIR